MIARALHVAVIVLFLFGLVNCTKQEPVASFSVKNEVVEAGKTVNFTDRSINAPTAWDWTFQGGTPFTSTSQNPTVTYEQAGTFEVSLMVSNKDGSDAVSRANFITVTDPNTDITFNNTTYTEIHLEINGLEKVIPPGGNMTYFDLTGNSVDYFAWTSGETAGGTQVGYQLTWDNTIALTEPEISRTLLIDKNYYFLYIRNEGTESLNPLEVGIMNVINGFSADRTEDILIPNDDTEYSIGYYKSYAPTEFNWIQIRAHAADWFAYWSQGEQFTLPDTSNQSIHLYSTAKKRSAESSWMDPGDQGIFLYPDYAVELKAPL